MFERLEKPLAILLMIGLPLAWGLGVEYLFELIRRQRNSRLETKDEAQ